MSRKPATKKPAAKKPAAKKPAAKKPTAKKPAAKKLETLATDEVPPFERVWAIVSRIPRGRVMTYGQISERIDRRLTPVGVGWALQAAPAEALPWFRVVNGKGGVSTDDRNPGLQRSLLEAEKVKFRPDGTIDLERYGVD